MARDARFVMQIARSGLVGCYRGIGPVERYARTQAWRAVQLVAVVARNIVLLVPARVPERKMTIARMATETDGRLLVGGDGLVVESEDSAYPTAAALLGVLERPLSVARRAIRAALVARLSVLGRKISFNVLGTGRSAARGTPTQVRRTVILQTQ